MYSHRSFGNLSPRHRSMTVDSLASLAESRFGQIDIHDDNDEYTVSGYGIDCSLGGNIEVLTSYFFLFSYFCSNRHPIQSIFLHPPILFHLSLPSHSFYHDKRLITLTEREREKERLCAHFIVADETQRGLCRDNGNVIMIV